MSAADRPVVLRVERGDIDEAGLAALTVVLLARVAAGPPPAAPRRVPARWRRPERALRTHGPRTWHRRP